MPVKPPADKPLASSFIPSTNIYRPPTLCQALGQRIKGKFCLPGTTESCNTGTFPEYESRLYACPLTASRSDPRGPTNPELTGGAAPRGSGGKAPACSTSPDRAHRPRSSAFGARRRLAGRIPGISLADREPHPHPIAVEPGCSRGRAPTLLGEPRQRAARHHPPLAPRPSSPSPKPPGHTQGPTRAQLPRTRLCAQCVPPG